MVKNGIILLWKVFSAFLRGISSNHVGDFYCLSCFHSYRTEKRNSNMQWSWLFYVEMPNEDNKILKYNYAEKSLKVPAIIFADLE